MILEGGVRSGGNGYDQQDMIRRIKPNIKGFDWVSERRKERGFGDVGRILRRIFILIIIKARLKMERGTIGWQREYREEW